MGQSVNPAVPSGVELGPLQDGRAVLRLSGIWSLQHPLPDSGVMRAGLEAMPGLKAIAFQADSLAAWDSAPVSYLMEIIDACRTLGVDTGEDGLPLD